ncbi:MAG: sodium:solute symporter family protein, partial [Pygmaiobacter sp.]
DSISKFFIGERKLTLWRCIATFCGTWISAASILSVTGSVYESGYAVLIFSVFPWFIGGFLLIGISDRLYDNDIITIPELFYKRYNSKGLQVVYAIIFIFVYIFYLVIQIKGFGIVASTLFGIPYTISVLLVYLFILYTTFGGYRSVTRSDAFNLILLIISLAVLFITITSRAGGLSAIHTGAEQISGYAHAGMDYPTEPGDLLKAFGKGSFAPLMNLSMFFGWGLGLAANPQYTVRMVSAKNRKTAKQAVILSLVLLVFVYFALSQIGLGMRVMIPALSAVDTTDEIFTYILNNNLYSRWSGFFFFSIIGACISTANSQLLLIASSFSYDIVHTLSRKPRSESTLLGLSRLSILAGGTISLLLAISPPVSLLTYGGDIWGVISSTLFPTMYATLLFKRTTRTGVWASLITGALSIAVFYPLYYAKLLPFHPALPGVLLSSLALFIGSFLTRTLASSQQILPEAPAGKDDAI